MVGIPAKPIPVEVKPATQQFVPYGTPCSEKFDPQTQKLELLQCQLEDMQKRIAVLMEERKSAPQVASAANTDGDNLPDEPAPATGSARRRRGSAGQG